MPNQKIDLGLRFTIFLMCITILGFGTFFWMVAGSQIIKEADSIQSKSIWLGAFNKIKTKRSGRMFFSGKFTIPAGSSRTIRIPIDTRPIHKRPILRYILIMVAMAASAIVAVLQDYFHKQIKNDIQTVHEIIKKSRKLKLSLNFEPEKIVIRNHDGFSETRRIKTLKSIRRKKDAVLLSFSSFLVSDSIRFENVEDFNFFKKLLDKELITEDEYAEKRPSLTIF